MTPRRRAVRAILAIAELERARPASTVDDDALERSLRAQPVHPGYYWDSKTKRFELRGEYVDIPKRFLALATRKERARPGFASQALGDVDDRAGALGFEDGDALRAWMLERPDRGYYVRSGSRTVRAYSVRNALAVKRILEAHGELGVTIARAEGELEHAIAAPRDYGAYRSAKRTAKARAKAREAGRCIVCRREEARKGRRTCFLCNARACERMARRREAEKESKRNA
jgi:hypothetical protein